MYAFDTYTDIGVTVRFALVRSSFNVINTYLNCLENLFTTISKDVTTVTLTSRDFRVIGLDVLRARKKKL